jgi:hypothetical protein
VITTAVVKSRYVHALLLPFDMNCDLVAAYMILGSHYHLELVSDYYHVHVLGICVYAGVPLNASFFSV